MMELPLPVVIAALIHEKRILLIKRVKGSYIGLWGLPGGKIEKNEHVSEAAVREIMEETGIRSEFKQHLGFVSEHLIDKNVVQQHFLLHLCELHPLTTQTIQGREGKASWFALPELPTVKEKIIPSDYAMIEKMILSSGKSYFNCVVERAGESHFLKRFE